MVSKISWEVKGNIRHSLSAVSHRLLAFYDRSKNHKLTTNFFENSQKPAANRRYLLNPVHIAENVLVLKNNFNSQLFPGGFQFTFDCQQIFVGVGNIDEQNHGENIL